ncbi:hypothetical protein WOLCODRAFT_160777 [Wolfiporia cocos MD-104 SS10]|uniref:DUF6534 domain-containing protein n=1 Tax=Wolfiporia cocos (strain MD-104) TaxID=742152 RepID=A0A2H3IWE6_WOLCO|nr:hypothetical protein WOLCODRAFT_160777 [Wolfiporia cocos MD-104 SS10]
MFAVMQYRKSRFYGFSLAQTTYYYLHYPADRSFLKYFVALLWIFDTVRTALDLQYLWYFVVDSHGNPNGLASFPVSWIVEFFLATVTVLAVQLYFVDTIWKFLAEKQYKYPVVLSLIAFCLTSCAGGLATVWEFTRSSNVKQALLNATYTGCIQTISATIADIYIAVAMSSILHKRRTGWARTDSLLTKLVVFAIHRGILAAIMQLGHFISFISTLDDLPDDLYWALFHFPGTKIYVNSLLAVLNLRNHLRQTQAPAQSNVESSIPLDDFPPRTRSQSRKHRRNEVVMQSPPSPLDGILITTETIHDRFTELKTI